MPLSERIMQILRSRKFHLLLLGLLAVDGIVLLVYFYGPSSGYTISRDGVTLMPATVRVDRRTSDVVVNILSRDAITRGIYRYAITNVSDVEGQKIVSVAGLPQNAPDNWTLEDAAWLGVITISPDQPNALEEMQPANEPLPYLETIGSGTGGAGDILPFAKGTQAQYGMLAIHSCGFGLTGWWAVDLFPSDGAVYTSSAGDISYICRDGTQMSIRVGNKMYAHLVDTGIQAGNHLEQGQMISTVVKGTFNATCGNASQAADVGHVHFCFEPENGGNTYTSDGYVLSISTLHWVKEGEDVAPLEYLTATWQDANLPAPGPAVGANFFDGIAEGLVLFAQAVVPTLPVHEAMGIADTVMGKIKAPFDLLYAIVLANFNMDICLWVFGIIMTLEAVRLVYSAYMWVKNAIPVIG